MGRSVYLGPAYVGSSSLAGVGSGPWSWLSNGDPDRLLEQAVAWASTKPIVANQSFSIAEDSAFEFFRLLGDANGDAIVDMADTAVVDSLFGRVGINLDGDLNGDGIVNSSDKSFTLRNYRGRKLADGLKPLLDD